MEEIQRWVLTICAASVLATMLGYFIKSEKSFSVIKTVLALYILVTVFSPQNIANIISAQNTSPSFQLQGEQIDSQAIIERNAAGTLQNQFNQLLQEKGIAAQCTAIELSSDLTSVVSVTIDADKQDAFTQINGIAKEFFGTEVIVR